MYKNKLIELITDNNIKIEFYKILNSGSELYYSNNLRGIPRHTYEEIISSTRTITYIIDPNKYQLEYVSDKIITIEVAVNEFYTPDDIELLKELYVNDYEEFIYVLKEDSIQIYQYDYEEIVKYIISLMEV